MNEPLQTPPTNKGEQQAENNIPPTPNIGDKNSKSKWIGVGVLATLVIIGVVVAIWFGFLKNDSNQNVTPTPISSPVDSSVWELTLAKGEVKAQNNLVENNLIYAVKSEYTSTIYKKNLQS